jgi:hypothetical protein
MRHAVCPIPNHLRSANSAKSKQNSQFPEGPGKERKDVWAWTEKEEEEAEEEAEEEEEEEEEEENG